MSYTECEWMQLNQINIIKIYLITTYQKITYNNLVYLKHLKNGELWGLKVKFYII